jgi:hypothetical protein
MNKPDFWPSRSSEELNAQCCDRKASVIAGLPLEVKGYPDLLRERDIEPAFVPVKSNE